MKKIRLRTLAVLGGACLTGALLLHASQNVQQTEDKLGALRASIEREREAIAVLNAEWAYLNNPARIEKLAKEYLDLVPPATGAIVSGAQEIPATPEPAAEEIMAPPQESAPAPQPVAFKLAKPSSPVSPAANSSGGDFSDLLRRLERGGAP